MNGNEKKIFGLLDELAKMDFIKPGEIPSVELYMDQVTTFMDTCLKQGKRHPEDKVLTKTMINNYTKNKLLPPPEKKKYSKDHMLLLIFIYYFKSFLSIGDIQKLLSPVCSQYFKQDGDYSLENIYIEVFSHAKEQTDSLTESLKKAYACTTDAFPGFPEDDREMLQMFSFICSLSFDVYIKKQMIESLIDQMPSQEKEGK